MGTSKWETVKDEIWGGGEREDVGVDLERGTEKTEKSVI